MRIRAEERPFSARPATALFAVLILAGLLLATTHAPASAAEVKQVGLGANNSCALSQAGAISCWGRDESGVLKTPKGRFTQMSVGDSHGCALRKTDRAVCWGSDDGAQLGETVAKGEWRSITAGYYQTCGIRPKGTAECFGAEEAINDAPSGRFRSVSLGAFYACGLRPSGKVICWGDVREGETNPPAGQFSRLSIGAYSACAQKRSGRLSCWGSDAYGLVSQLDGRIAGAIRISEQNYCGFPKGAGNLVCGGADNPVAYPPPGRFVSVALSSFSSHACAVRPDRKLVCWGDNGFGQTDVPRAFRPTAR